MSNINRFLAQQLHSNNGSAPNLNITDENGSNNHTGQGLNSWNSDMNFQSQNLPNQQPVYNIQMQNSSSFGQIPNEHLNNNTNLYQNQLLGVHHDNQSMHANQYSLLHPNLDSPQFNASMSNIPPMNSVTPNSIPLLNQQSANSLLQQPASSHILPNSVSMTPQLSTNSLLGVSDITSQDPNLNGNSAATNSSVGIGAEISSVPSRTVYLGNIPSGITPYELLNHVRSGTVESLKMISSKNCAFISFLDEKSATLFHSDAILKRLTINNHDIKIGWGKPTPVQPIVASCVSRYNATRNVYIGNLPENTSEKELANDTKEYGEIDTIKMIHEKKIAFIHFTSILAAIRCVQSLPLIEKYKDRRIFYGKDRCAFITKTQQHNAAQYLGLNPNTENFLSQVDRDLIANALVQQSNAAAMIATTTGGTSNLGNRTIYLGNLHPDSTIEEICNVVRGGILQNVRLINERHVCFVTFIDPISAAQFYAMSSLHGLIIHNRKIKIGWGKHSGPLPNSINLAVGNGASRNIYIGGLDKIPEIQFTKDKLYYDFKEFGEIEQINFFQERHCCFVNFTNISNAIKAIDGIRNNPDYQRCKINFGKDRCGNTPRQFQLNANGSNGNGNGNGNGEVENGLAPNDFNNFSATGNDINTVGGALNASATSGNGQFNYSSNSEGEGEEEEEDYIDEATIRFQPLGITFDEPSNPPQL